MSEPAREAFEKRKAIAVDLPVVKLQFTTSERLFEKYEVVVIGDGCYVIISRPVRTEAGLFTYDIVPYGTNLADLTVTLVDDLLPEL